MGLFMVDGVGGGRFPPPPLTKDFLFFYFFSILYRYVRAKK